MISLLKRFKAYTFGFGFILCVTLFSSCVSYQYVTLSSSLEQGESKDFYVENDSVLVWFSFDGMYGPVIIEINNKLSKPVYVNWAKSSLIVNGQSHRFSPLSIIDFIPPQSYITQAPTYLAYDPFILPDKSLSTKVKISSSNGVKNGREYRFQPDRSPVSFRCFLTLSTDESFVNEFYFDTSFWATDITTSNAPPTAFQRRGDQFYLAELSKTGYFLSGVSTITLLIMTLAVAAF